MKGKRNGKSSYINVIFIVLVLNIILLNINVNQEPRNIAEFNKLGDNNEINRAGLKTYTLEWLDNNTFDPPVTEWYNDTEGDATDVNASISNGYGNLELLGDSDSFSSTTFETYPNSTGTWVTSNNSHSYPVMVPGSPEIQSYGIDQGGWWCSHEWDQNAGDAVDQFPSINWRKNYSVDVDLADYTITSASIDAVINATVTAITYGAGGLETPGDAIPQEYAVYDFARFYIQIENIERTHKFEIAYNKTRYLGDDHNADAFDLDHMSNIHLNSYGEDILIAYLTAIFQNTAYDMFTIILGIDIFCEDNVQVDNDKFNELRFNNFSLNFTYVKNMDRYAAISWNQGGNQVPFAGVNVVYGHLEFDLKCDQKFVADSPNSEIRALINGNKFVQTVKLTAINLTSDHIYLDVTPLIQKGMNITTSIQLMLLDNFVLNDTYMVSIDNVSLEIQYEFTGALDNTDYVLKFNGVNKTLSKLLEIEWGELVNVTFVYRNSTKGFIDNATVQISGAIPTANLTENNTLGHYNITIDTSGLSLGENVFTIFASKLAFVDQEITMVIKVIKRTAEMNIILNDVNKTADKSIFLNSGDPLNITIKLRDSITKNFVDSADVKIYNGAYWNKTLNETISLAHYNTSVNTTTELNPGITFLTLLINKPYYEIIGDSITVSISVRASNYSLWLDGVDKTAYPTIKKNVNETIDIRFYYRDELTESHIPSADISLTVAGTDYDLDENAGGGYYNISINTLILNQGINFATLFAQNPLYSPQAALITIEIVQNQTDYSLKINGTDKKSEPIYTVIIGNDINITVAYFDNTTKTHITNASLDLYGGNVDGNLTENKALKQYTIIIDSNTLSATINFLTIYAIKANFEAITIPIQINVIDKTSSSNLFLDTLNKTSEKYIKKDWNELINVTITYLDNSSDPITGATVTLSGGGILKNLQYTSGQYEYMLNTSELDLGVNFLVLLARKTNYDTQTFSIQIEVSRRVTKIDQIFLNQDETKTYEIPWNELLNVSIVYIDNVTSNFLDGATVQLKSGTKLIGTLLKDPTYDQYNLTFNTDVLKVGLTYLTISVVLENHTSVSEIITLNILNRDTDLNILLNQTATTSIEIFWNETLDIDITYNDTISGLLIEGATIELLDGETVIGNFTRHPTLNLYNFSINTMDLGVGAVYLTISAVKGNYSSISNFILINVKERRTFYHLFINGENVTDSKYYEIPLGGTLNISIKYFDLEHNVSISGASIELDQEPGKLFAEVGSIYWRNITLSDDKYDIELNIFTIEASIQNYSLENPTLRINVKQIVCEIDPKGGKVIEVEPGEIITVSIELIVTDLQSPLYGEKITGATVIFTSNIPIEDYKQGKLKEVKDGVYEIELEEVPEGTYTFSITVLGGGEYDNYNFERFDMTITVKSPPEDVFWYRFFVTLAVLATICIAIYAIYYQKVGKYPKPVRKVHKTKKMIKKKKAVALDVPVRSDLFRDLYKEEFEDRAKFLVPKLTPPVTSLKDKLATKPTPTTEIKKQPVVDKKAEKAKKEEAKKAEKAKKEEAKKAELLKKAEELEQKKKSKK